MHIASALQALEWPWKLKVECKTKIILYVQDRQEGGQNTWVECGYTATQSHYSEHLHILGMC